MKSFKEFLIEIKLSINQAREILGLQPASFTAAELKTAFRRASSKNHPDKGGSTEAMQKVNAANALLKRHTSNVSQQGSGSSSSTGSTASPKVDPNHWKTQREKVRTEHKEIANGLLKAMNIMIDIPKYSRYFGEVFKEPFTGMIIKTEPDPDMKTTPHLAVMEIEWVNSDRSKVFTMYNMVQIAGVRRDRMSATLGSKSTSFNMTTVLSAFVNNRKTKLGSTDFDSSRDRTKINQPEKMFPRAKINRQKQTKFKKADFLLGLKTIGAIKFGENQHIPMKDNIYLSVFRTTLNRQAFWNMGHFYFKKPTHWGIEMKSPGFKSFPENEETLSVFKSLKTKTIDQTIKTLDDYYKKIIDSYK